MNIFICFDYSDKSAVNGTDNTLYRELRNIHKNTFRLNINEVFIILAKDNYKIKSEYTEYKINFNDIFIIRPYYNEYGNSKRFINSLLFLKNILGLKIYNDIVYTNLFCDKHYSYLYLKKNEIDTPETYYFQNKSFFKKPKLKFPVIIKPIDKFGGYGVKKIYNYDFIIKDCYNEGFLIQEYIQHDKVLVATIFKNIHITYERYIECKSDIINSSNSQPVYDCNVSSDEALFINKVRNIFDSYFDYYSINIIESENLYCLEINPAPALVKDIKYFIQMIKKTHEI